MRFIVYDVRDHTRRAIVERDAWRATLAVLHQASVLTKEQANRLVWLLGGVGTSIAPGETKLIADYLTMFLLPQLVPGQVVTAQPGDVEFEDVTDGTTIFGMEPGKASSARRPVRLTRQWLESLAELCAGTTELAAISEDARATWPERPAGTRPHSE